MTVTSFHSRIFNFIVIRARDNFVLRTLTSHTNYIIMLTVQAAVQVQWQMLHTGAKTAGKRTRMPLAYPCPVVLLLAPNIDTGVH